MRRGEVNLCRILAVEAAAAHICKALICVNHDLASRQPGISVEASDLELACRVDQKLVYRQSVLSGDLRRDILDDPVRLVSFLLGILIGYGKCPDARELLSLFVSAGDLCLAVGEEALVLPAQLLVSHGELLKYDHGDRELLRRIAARVAEHHALISRAVLVHAHGDISRLHTDIVDDLISRRVVAYLAEHIGGYLLHVDHSLGRDLAGDEDLALASHRLDTGSGIRILLHARLQDGGADLIADLVRVTSEYYLVAVIIHLYLSFLCLHTAAVCLVKQIAHRNDGRYIHMIPSFKL